MSDRKYRQQGYQDSERGGERARRSQGPRERPEGPRGRGLGAPTREVVRCAVCGQEQPHGVVAEDAACEKCGADLHTCTHCRHFDTASRFECRAEVSERITKKSARNRCDLFSPKVAKELDSDRREPSDPRAAFDALFKI